jgi:putative alpha-1,2-mannosidase
MTYWHSDYALGNAARFLGKDALRNLDPAFENDAENLTARANGWTKLLDPETGFFRLKSISGHFVPGFDEFAWGPRAGYTEAGAWQYRVEVPYDPQALNAAFKKIGYDGCDIVQQANTIPSIFHVGGYGSEIHEMSEMAINDWGQWELDNQPVWALQHMQVGFDTSVTGKCANQAQKWLRKSNSALSGGADMYPGDEDNGSMGSWFIMNMLGFYPLNPAGGNYVIGSPMFAKSTIKVAGASKPLTIVAKNQSPENVYVHALTWNGKPVHGVEMKYSDLMEGGTLEFTMGAQPLAQTQSQILMI